MRDGDAVAAWLGGRILRVFPSRTEMTPTDALAFVGDPPLPFARPAPADIDEVHVSCTFTWDRQEVERLADAWRTLGYRVRLGGPAYGDPGGEFTPGLYVARGGVMTSRGCIRRCAHCFVPEREGRLRTLAIKQGWDVLDNNLLACPRPHIEAVLDMLETQPRAARFSGGIDARLCRPWFAARLAAMRVDILYTAWDSPGQMADAERAIGILRAAGLRQRQVGCYVLMGYDGDTPDQAESRAECVLEFGGMPFAMYYRADKSSKVQTPPEWHPLVRKFSRPAIMFATPKPPAELWPESA